MSKTVEQAYIDAVNNRRLIGGVEDKLMCMSPLKHPWALEIYDVMIANTWHPTEVDMGRDIKQYRGNDLTDGERGAYDKALAFLSNLDGIQFNNLADNIGRYITSPEAKLCIARQVWEEGNHVMSYLKMVDAISARPQEIYTMFARDGILAKKNDYITRQSELLGNEYSPRNFALAVVSNIILEGIYFYSGFLTFYTLARSGKMLNSADMIRFIQRDEVVHLNLFVHFFNTLRKENPEIFNAQFEADVRRLFKEAKDLEATWGKYIIKGGVLGLTDTIVDGYLESLVDKRIGMIGYSPVYGTKNPVEWVEKFSDINNEEANFFESKVKAYSTGGALKW